MERDERVRVLVELSKNMQRHGQLYLAIELVREAFGRECLEAFIRGETMDQALVRLTARLRRIPAAAPAAIAPAIPRTRKPKVRPQPMPLPAIETEGLV